MRRLLLLAALGSCPLLCAAPAGAATVSCDPGVYAPGLESGDPIVELIKARGLPRRTDGYAPPCLVAESVAARVQAGSSDDVPPRRVRVFGARWNGGTWRCTYDLRNATCRKAGKPRRRVTFFINLEKV